MSAGTGVRHAEYNLEGRDRRPCSRSGSSRPSGAARPAGAPSHSPRATRSGSFQTLASGDEADADALHIRTDAKVLGATLKAGETTTYALGEGRHAYLVPAVGAIRVNGVQLDARDGAAIKDEVELVVEALDDAEIVMVDAAA